MVTIIILAMSGLAAFMLWCVVRGGGRPCG
jgi:hypothetical protein